ncbi:MAG: serine/threonine-protein kinase, partial [Myxococcota bacterium]
MSKELRAEAERRLGHRIAGKYHLRDVLGVGGMGVVYAAWHQFTERMVALKLLHASIARTQTHAQRFLQEATASGAIGHPGIAEALDAGRDADGCLYVAFELLKGEDLGAAIVGGRASPLRVLEVSEEVLSALSAAHNEGFIHRDIKPANIFLLDQSKNNVRSKLLDFGIARRVRASGSSEGLTQAGAVVGTPYYMSPEQMCGEAVDGRADLWALAVVIYYGLTGDLPFQGRSYVALLTEMLRRGPPSLPRMDAIPHGAEAILKQALAPRIEDRFQSAGSMRIAISGILPSPASNEVTEPAVPERTAPLSRRAQTPLTP